MCVLIGCSTTNIMFIFFGYCKINSVAMDTSIEQVVQKVWEVIMTHSQDIYTPELLYRFETWELQYFPLRYLIRFAKPNELRVVWSRLPKSYQENKELQECLPCSKHHNAGSSRIYGPPPPRQRDCSKCLS